MFTLKLVLGLLLAWKIFWYLMYRLSISDDQYRNYAKMKWSMIKNFYPINPDKWTYNDKPYPTSCYHGKNKVMLNLRYDKVPIMLSFIDYEILKYHFRKYKRKHKHDVNIEVLETILKDVQVDIDEKKKEAQRQIKQAEEMMKEVCNNGTDYLA